MIGKKAPLYLSKSWRGITLTKGYIAVVDVDNFDVLNQWRWHAIEKGGGKVYAHRWEKRRGVLMHRYIMGAFGPIDIDHINGDTLDNRKSNLRRSSHRQNLYNRSAIKGREYKGVYWEESRRKWAVRFRLPDGSFPLFGRFSELQDATHRSNEVMVELHGDFAWLN